MTQVFLPNSPVSPQYFQVILETNKIQLLISELKMM